MDGDSSEGAQPGVGTEDSSEGPSLSRKAGGVSVGSSTLWDEDEEEEEKENTAFPLG